MSAVPSTAADDGDVVGLLSESAADFCARALPRARLRGLRGARPAFDRSAWREMAELGWSGILLDEGRGGLGLGLPAALAVARALGRVAAPEPFVECAVAAASVLGAAEAPALTAAVLTGERVIVAALGNFGDDPFALVAAHPDPQGVRLFGRIAPLPVAPDADVWLVPARLDGEAAWCVVEAGNTGIEATPRELADGTRDADVEFVDVAASVLCTGLAAQTALADARGRSEAASAAYLVGLAETLFEMTREYVGTRRQFGQAIGSFQAVQHRLVDVYLGLRLAAATLDEGVEAIEQGPVEAAARAASRLRYRACTTALHAAREAVQLHGAIGYTDECDVGLLLNRALVVCARYGQAGQHAARLARIGFGEGGADGAAETPAVDPELVPPDGDWNALDNGRFRAVVRAWHEAHYPVALRHPRRRLRWHECRDWYQTLHRRGWAAPGWPRAHGGMGLAPDKLLIFIEERERLGVARTPDQGIIMIGPLLMAHGSAAQQAHYLPKALSGEHIWCQGYSEPNAGSDLASLRTSAVLDGDDFVVNGQKIWTTLAQDANQMFCLVRTDAEAKPQAGISFVLIDLASPGITIRPIRNLAGDEEFCEVFFDDVRVPVSNLVGQLNDGWTIAKALLGFERFFVGSPKTCRFALGRLGALAAARGLAEDPVYRDRYIRDALDVADLEALYKAFADQIRRGETLGADVSLLKIFASETYARLSETILEIAGEAGAQVEAVDFGADEPIDVLSPYYNARPTPIYGGSNEIQRNILAKAVLGLPSR
ncbi:MAG: acyl-CoA dehydrogenase family protein [Gammaproteobacteria bacterium]|nr:acyl-CoA dehydrogenase family protein [Gammaproteobacteria bacterium]